MMLKNLFKNKKPNKVLINGALFYSLGFNDALKPLFYQMCEFHDFCMVMVMIMGFVMMFSLGYMWTYGKYKDGMMHSMFMEFMWTLVPAGILLYLCVESLRLLYFLEDGLSYMNYYFKYCSLSEDSGMSNPIKVTGKQWYWSYEYIFGMNKLKDKDVMEYDSYLLRGESLFNGGQRKLEAEKPMSVMCGNLTPLNMTSGDTAHSFSVTSLGFKMDAIPGRMNSGLLCSQVCGSFYGQCSEMCGANHSFMPIEVESVMNCM